MRIFSWIIHHWKILLPVFATLIGVFVAAMVSLFIHFDNKSNGQITPSVREASRQIETETTQNSELHDRSTLNHSENLPLKTTLSIPITPAVPPIPSVQTETKQVESSKQSGDEINASGNGIAIKQDGNGAIIISR